MQPEAAKEHDEQPDEPGFGESLPLLFNVVYCSRATADIDDAAVAHIIATSHRHNPRSGITGMLVFGGGIFFQWLEGPREGILRLMALLRTDTRHEQLVVLSEAEEARERLFPQWAMELVGADHVRDVLADALHDAEDEQKAAALRAMLADVDALWGPATPASPA